MELKKKTFLEAYQKTFGNITQACKKAGINRGTYYNWMEADPEFNDLIKSVEPEEMFLDFCEGKLASLINENNPTAVIFALKTKGKKRGYVERTETDITTKGEQIRGWEIVPASFKDETED